MSNTIGTTSGRVKPDSERSCERQARDGKEETGARALIAVVLFFLFFLLFLPLNDREYRINNSNRVGTISRAGGLPRPRPMVESHVGGKSSA
jgi:hypothetical protein